MRQEDIKRSEPLGRETRKWPLVNFLMLTLVLSVIIVFNQAALNDRFLLVLYTISITGAIYALVKRRALVFAVMAVAVAGAVLLTNIYFATECVEWHPLLDPIRDFAALTVLSLLVAQLVFEAYRVQKEEKEREAQRQFEERLVSLRAAALRSTSHEVRTPLSAIITINETLLSESTGALNEVQREFLQDIDDSTRHLMNLVNDILDYAKAEVGMIQLAPEPVALVELVEQCVKMVEPKAKAADVTINAQVASDLTEIVADPLRLKQVVLNLLSNAVKYNHQGGMVSVRIREDGDDVLISVRDTGRGIAPEHIEHLFNPYYQASRKDQSIGTGLGLAIIKHLTELHGGSITVESVSGAGSVFTVRIPKAANVTSDADGEIQSLRALGAEPANVNKKSELGVSV